MNSCLARADAFCSRFGLRVPILLAPMAGACPPSLSIAVAKAGALGSAGVLLMPPDGIKAWATAVRAETNGAFQLNNWIPDPPPVRDSAAEAKVRDFLGAWGPPVPADAGDATPPDFAAQCHAMLEVGPSIISSIMGIYPAEIVTEMKRRGIVWIAGVTTVAEAKTAEAAGADVIVAQGAEAGGHRGAFEAGEAERRLVGLFALLPAVVDAVAVPVVAAGGIGDGRTIAAALMLGASAAQIGTAFLRSPEAQTAPAWADALAQAQPEDTMVTRAFSGRAGRSVANAYVKAAAAHDAPDPAPYPVQRGLTAAMRTTASKANDFEAMQAWAGQAARLAVAEPAHAIVERLWHDAQVAFD